MVIPPLIFMIKAYHIQGVKSIQFIHLCECACDADSLGENKEGIVAAFPKTDITILKVLYPVLYEAAKNGLIIDAPGNSCYI